MCIRDRLVPSAWNERESVRWHYDERRLNREWCSERETELYKVKRDYNELKERLNDMKYLPVKIESDDSYLNNNNVTYDDKIIDLVFRKITYGDWTKLIDSDKLYDIINGTTKDIEIMVCNNNNNNKSCINKEEKCY